MTRPEVNAAIVQNYLKANDYSSLTEYLKRVFKLERNEAGVPKAYELSCDAVTALHAILRSIVQTEINESHRDIIKELFRSLRNYAISADVQDYLISNNNLLDDVDQILNLKNRIVVDVLHIILQFLVNLIVSNKSATDVVFDKFSKHIFSFLKDKLCIYETTALLYNISLHKDLILDFYICNYILDLYDSDCNIEFVCFLLEKLFTYDYFWDYYKKFELNLRMIVLGAIRAKQIKGESISLPKHGLEILAKDFITSAEIIFQMVASESYDLKPFEIAKLLEVISSFSGTENYLKILQKDKDLLINSGVLLINIHRLGKDSQNCFSSIQSLSEARDPNSYIHEHPAFGFKADLIRIIGNLCWKDRSMQDLTREAELIPVILDCCNMDARNPLIMQWVILAVRNLCEDNIENKKIIAEMHQQGVVSSSVLEEFGLTLSSDENNSLKVVPLEVLRNKK